MDPQAPQNHEPLIVFNRDSLIWMVAGAVLLLSIAFIAGWKQAGWIFMLCGLSLLGIAVYRTFEHPIRREMFKKWYFQISPGLKWSALGVTLLIIGILARFSPRDVSFGLSVIGLLILLAGFSPQLLRINAAPFTSMQANNMNESGAKLLENTSANSRLEYESEDSQTMDGFSRISEDFRWRVSEAVFNNAQRASQVSFVVSLAFFVVGIGVFILLVYGVYQFLATSSEEPSQIMTNIMGLIANMFNSTTYFDPIMVLGQVLLLLLLLLVQFTPLLGLFLIGWIAGRMILNATHLSQRRVIQETLAELGPLQSTLAGIPPRKPILQVVEQSLAQARRSFTVRTYLSIILFLVGIVLFVALAIYGFKTGFGDPLTTATVGGSGIISFIFSMVSNRQSEIRGTLSEITRLEIDVAKQAQRSEMLDLYMSQIIQKRGQSQNLNQFKELLELLELSEAPETVLKQAKKGGEQSEQKHAPVPAST